MVSFLSDVLKNPLTSLMKMFIFCGRCKNVNAIVQTNTIQQETIQWIIDITDIYYMFYWLFFDEEGLQTRHWKANIGTRHGKTIFEVKSMKEILR